MNTDRTVRVYGVAIATLTAQLEPAQRNDAAAKLREIANERRMGIDDLDADFFRDLADQIEASR